MPVHCFTYGSLMCDDIMASVCGIPRANLVSRAARLPHFTRHPVIGETYPGMVPSPAVSVSGVLYLNLPEAVWPRLDVFEGEMYERMPVSVETEEGTVLPAETYVFRPEFAHRLTAGPWDFEAFVSKGGKARFQARYLGFREL